MNVYELNMDGLVGPSHHYAGLAAGNIASKKNAATLSNPLAAAKQGIDKMRLLHSMGLKQALLPPHQRPNLQLLWQLGFTGKPKEQINKASRYPNILSICYSAASMWTANAATVHPSSDTYDKTVHFTPANLVSNLHRQQETDFTKQLLELIFSNPNYFSHHYPLPCSSMLSDEGAANHNRLCQTHKGKGLHLFVYGKQGLMPDKTPVPRKYPARQCFDASLAIARKHQLPSDRVLFAQQLPEAIDRGVFHNDVISVANESLLFIHEKAFYNQEVILSKLRNMADFPLTIIEVDNHSLSLKEAVDSYLFNSQLLSLPNQSGMILLAPIECQTNPRVNTTITNLINSSTNPIQKVYYLNLKQSMKNGGGPACLRLRIPLTEEELMHMHAGVLVDESLLRALDTWVEQHYRQELVAADLADPELMDECFKALDELTSLLRLGPIYPFQQ